MHMNYKLYIFKHESSSKVAENLIEEREHIFDKAIGCKLADTECQISEIDNNNYRQERSPYNSYSKEVLREVGFD